LSTPGLPPKAVSVLDLARKKEQAQPITMLTAYDYSTARAIDAAGLDVILVGDSLGMVVLGYTSTLPVTMEEMLHHCRAVARGACRALLVGDMPFLSYQVSVPEAVRNAGRFLQEGGMGAVKLEGGREMVPTTRAIVNAGIPVMGHLGLTPQSIHKLGGHKPQGRTARAARRLLEDAQALQDAGIFALVLESIPARVAGLISRDLTIPTIGIGAGPECDGQVLVTNDLLGLFDRFTPRFVRQYAHFYEAMGHAFQLYREDVEKHSFPAAEHCIDLPEPEWQDLLTSLPGGRERPGREHA
jgi:3-methyl-2-oxobutanoate hydroxymethyltransferase